MPHIENLKLQESGEMYLETILRISEEKPYVRSIDISERMGFSKPSVSRAMSILHDGGFIKIADDKTITLTDAGMEVAQKIYERHKVLTEWLVNLGVNRETAENDACRMEHIISDETFNAIRSCKIKSDD